MGKKLREANIRFLEKVAKNTPHLIASVGLTPIALPYTIFELVIWPCDEDVATECTDFFQTDRFADFWRRGFTNIRDAVKEYRERIYEISYNITEHMAE